jgi:hypothetical protein
VTGRAVASPVISVPVLDGTNFSFTFATTTGFTYVIQSKDAVEEAGWQTLQAETGDGTEKTIAFPVADAPRRFYRVVVE